MNQISYTVVLLDGKEKADLSLAEVQDLFFRRQINQNSLVSSSENPQWQMLKRVFDLTQFVPAAAPATSYQPTVNPFEQPVTFNQFPAPPASYGSGPAPAQFNGYTQNNQTPPHYQAPPPAPVDAGLQTGYYGAGYQNPPFNANYANAYPASVPAVRPGLKHAAVFLLVSAVVTILILLVENMFAAAMPDAPGTKYAPSPLRIGISLLIDLVLAYKLWQQDDFESARKWVLIRAYFGFVLYGLFLPFAAVGEIGIFVAFINFFTYLFFLVSVGLVLHGEKGPSPGRLMIGMGTFAVYCLMSFGIVALSSLVMIAPNLTQYAASTSQLEKYKIDGNDFEDAKTGAKVSLPAGWMQISTTNPVMSSPTARMIGLAKESGSMTMLDVVPVPAEIDIKNIRKSDLLDYLTDYVAENFDEIVREGNPRAGRITAREITRMSVQVGTHPAKLLVLETSMNNQKYRSHMVITFDELSMYILHSWCPTTNYEKAKEEFYALEKSFTIPDKIKSTFTQAAENERPGAPSKSGF